MRERIRRNLGEMFTTRDIITSAIFAAVVCAATLLIRIPVPATSGYINLGDSMVFISALLFGGKIGGISGGVGSALADILGGYGSWAPFTLIIKGAEGFFVGKLSHLGTTVSKKTVNVGFSVVLFLVGVLGLYALRDPDVGTMGMALKEINILIIIGALYIFFISLDIPYFVVALLVGGSILISGYFIVETVLYGVPAALAELPGNFFQAVSGILISVPVATAVKKALPQKF